MSADLKTELRATTIVCATRRNELLLQLQAMADETMRAHKAVSCDAWSDYEQAMDALARCRITVAAARARLEIALRHEEKLMRKAMDWELTASGEGRAA